MENTEVINPNALDFSDNGKTFEIIDAEKYNAETVFLDKKNFEPMVLKARDMARNLVADPLTKDGVIAIKSMAKKLGSLAKSIQEAHDVVAKELKAKPKIVDANNKFVQDSLKVYKEEVLKPLKEIEDRKAEIELIAGLPKTALGFNSEGIATVIDQLASHEHDLNYWKESFDEAQIALQNASRELDTMFNNAKTAEENARELERLRAEEQARKDEELRKAREEAERVRMENERLAREKADAERKAAEAEKKAEEATNIDVGEIAKAEGEAVKSGMIFNDDPKEYRKACNHEALADLIKVGLSEDVAKNVLNAIYKNLVRHVKLIY